MSRKLMMLGMMLTMMLVVAAPALAQNVILGDQDFAAPDQNAELANELANVVSTPIAQGQGSSNAAIDRSVLISANEFGDQTVEDVEVTNEVTNAQLNLPSADIDADQDIDF